MNKKCLSVFLVFIMLFMLTSCGKKAEVSQPEENTVPVENTEVSDSKEEPVKESEETKDAEESPKSETTPAADTQNAPTFTSELVEYKNSLTNDNGEEIYNSYIAYPKVTIPGYDYASNSINSYFEASFAEEIEEDKTIAQDAQDSYDYSLENEEYAFSPYSYEMKPAEENVLGNIYSVFYTCYADFGGAHPSSFYTGVSFDLTTGEPLSLRELAKNGPAFTYYIRDTIINEIKTDSLRDSELTSEDFFPDYEDTITDGFESEPNWYLQKDGVCIIFNTYDIAPYANGPVFVVFPWSEIKDYLKDELFTGFDF